MLAVLRVSIVIAVAVQILCTSVSDQSRLPDVVAVYKIKTRRGSAYQWGQRAKPSTRPSKNTTGFNGAPDTVSLAAGHKNQ